MERERLPWGPLTAGFVLTWAILAGLSVYEMRRPDGVMGTIQELAFKFGTAMDLPMPDPWKEAPKEATTKALPFFMALLAAIRLRSRGREGVVLTLGLAAFGLWLLRGLIWGMWDFWHILPMSLAVAALPAGDWIARGKDSAHRRLVGVTIVAGAFILASGIQGVVMVLWKRGGDASLDTLYGFFLGEAKVAPRHLLPYLPMIAVWYWKIPPLPKPQPAAA